MSTRPNVLWIQTDEQRPDSLGCYGSAWARTPNLDALAERGSVFRECHVQSPMCVPSRTSLLTARYPQELGVLTNAVFDEPDVLDPSMETIPSLFASAGYRTASLGKWHTPRHETWQELYDFPFFLDVADPVALHPPFTDEDHRVIKNPGSFMDGVEIPVILGGVYPHHDWGDDPAAHLTDVAVDWLRRAAASDQPFFLRVSHLWPHTPVLPPSPWDRLYAPEEVACAALNHRALEGRADYEQWLAGIERGMAMPMDAWRRAAADYYGLCAYLDHQVGRLVRTLEEAGILENTVVAYNADHGRAMGELGLCQKATYDQEVWRVPFILSGPGTEDGVRDDLCELIDLGRTLCGLAGVEPTQGMRGRDLFDSEEPAAVFGVLDLGPHRRVGVRTRRYRYDCTVRHDGEPTDRGSRDANLIDLVEDPAQTVNLASDPRMRPVVEQMDALVDDWMALGTG